ncbi:hypothetical protein GDO78_015720 [Eleutherodactylus coqui]|uniref:tRNA (adenine(58)-N(1))-methyltransferase n=1 Tax=Eleutherodactylus coqui TaxID=57060 RepID=A0A8J6JNY7_ELECQ|nr:hypothetical protein GDO78_015720 [Eleutherodactylus coqui]
MLLMMDVNPGDVILEAGSGSGALSLFLSRAVGPEGCIHSVEVRSDHHYASRKNFLTWKSAWEFGSGRRWPDNVNFIKKDVLDAMSDLKAVAFDAVSNIRASCGVARYRLVFSPVCLVLQVALDMLNPQVVLPGIVRNLKQGAVCAVYVVNITQVIDLLEGIRSCQLPLICEKVMEVSVTNWLVAPLLRKDGRISKRVTPQCNLTAEGQTQDQSDDDDGQTEEDDSVIGSRPFGQLPYIARPLPWQVGHTAFLVQLRKCKATAEATERGAPR